MRIGGSLWLKSLTKAFLLTNGHESTHYTCSTLIFVGGDCQLRPIERMAWDSSVNSFCHCCVTGAALPRAPSAHESATRQDTWNGKTSFTRPLAPVTDVWIRKWPGAADAGDLGPAPGWAHRCNLRSRGGDRPTTPWKNLSSFSSSSSPPILARRRLEYQSAPRLDCQIDQRRRDVWDELCLFIVFFIWFVCFFPCGNRTPEDAVTCRRIGARSTVTALGHFMFEGHPVFFMYQLVIHCQLGEMAQELVDPIEHNCSCCCSCCCCFCFCCCWFFFFNLLFTPQ